ncbi:MAG: hypothetical protein ACRDGA_09520 [Bacteroidota bacterium]
MYKKRFTIAILLASLTLTSAKGLAQACCSAGTPLLGSLEFPSTPAGIWQLTLTYDYNVLRDVLSGTQTLVDDSRRRVTHSLLWETSYGISSLFSISILLTAVQQERAISPESQSESLLHTRGVGDAVALIKYALIPLTLPSQQEVTIGAGGKIPLGASTLTSHGVLLPADMQPGTGAWDGILWIYASQGFVPRVPLNLFVIASYRLTGTNERYGTDQQGYRFGNELVASVGGGYRTDSNVDYSLTLRYRRVVPDQFGGSEIPNTGGIWLSLLPGLNVTLSDDLTARSSALIPLYRNLNGTQLTTSYGATISLFYVLRK